MSLPVPYFADIPLSYLVAVKTIQYVSVSCAALWIHDYLLTLERERALVWRSPWSLAKILFLVNRYSQIFDIVLMNVVLSAAQNENCKRLVPMAGWTASSEDLHIPPYLMSTLNFGCAPAPVGTNTAWRIYLVSLIYNTVDTAIAFIGGFRKYRVIDNPLLATMFYDVLSNAGLLVALFAPGEWSFTIDLGTRKQTVTNAIEHTLHTYPP
ncbi:hypothetical protein Clacol_003138 [Clathrus columnatus]|uniref:DUF6533 domain-containing protein n=1 Tax=Clathrus columnatus TaxID=1419009 RepID=A0AAV5A6R4_9AGAM|nr:hypothetical protein Clacol_003138 [Clathrus columnatus]